MSESRIEALNNALNHLRHIPGDWLLIQYDHARPGLVNVTTMSEDGLRLLDRERGLDAIAESLRKEGGP